MAALIPVFFVLLMAYAQYRRAKAQGQWSWPGFFLMLGAMALLVAAFIIPVVNSTTLRAHPDWMMGILLGGIFLFVGCLIYGIRCYYAARGYQFGNAKPTAAAGPGSDRVAAILFAMVCVFAVAAHAQSEKVYRDPSGVYSVEIPKGWEAQPQQGSPMVSLVDPTTRVSLTLGIMRGPQANTPSPEAQLKTLESQFPQTCPQAKVEQRGQEKIAGIPGVFVSVRCAGQDGPQLMKVIAATSPGLVAMVVANSPGNAYMKDILPIESIKRSLKVLPAQKTDYTPTPVPAGGNKSPYVDYAAMKDKDDSQPIVPSSPTAAPRGDSARYKDPQGRYSLAVPSGWNTASDNGNLTLSSGDSWVTVALGNGSQPADANHQIVQQIQAQFKDFKILNEGDFQNNGKPSHGTNATGINPKGARVSLLVVSIGAGNGNYLALISSAPNEQAKQINGMVMQIAQSVHFGS